GGPGRGRASRVAPTAAHKPRPTAIGDETKPHDGAILAGPVGRPTTDAAASASEVAAAGWEARSSARRAGTTGEAALQDGTGIRTSPAPRMGSAMTPASVASHTRWRVPAA